MWTCRLPRRRCLTSLGIASLLALVGCSSSGKGKGEGEGERERGAVALRAGDLFLATPAPPLPACPGGSPVTLDEELSLRFWVGPKVDIDLVLEQARAAQSSWSQHGLRLRAAGDVQRHEFDAVFRGDIEGFKKRLEEERRSKGRELSEKEETLLFANEVSASLRELISSIEVENRREVQVFFLPSLVASRSPASSLRELAGLTFSPLNPSTEVQQLIADLELGELPAPVVLLSQEQLLRLQKKERVTLLAHELGHALGLEHSRDPNLLMSLVRNGHCNPALPASASETISRALASAP